MKRPLEPTTEEDYEIPFKQFRTLSEQEQALINELPVCFRIAVSEKILKHREASDKQNLANLQEEHETFRMRYVEDIKTRYKAIKEKMKQNHGKVFEFKLEGTSYLPDKAMPLPFYGYVNPAIDLVLKTLNSELERKGWPSLSMASTGLSVRVKCDLRAK